MVVGQDGRHVGKFVVPDRVPLINSRHRDDNVTNTITDSANERRKKNEDANRATTGTNNAVIVNSARDGWAQ